MSGDKLFKPSDNGFKSPTTTSQRNGDIVNQPRFPEQGGFSSSKKGFKKNGLKVVPTGK